MEADRIANEIEKKKEKEIKDLGQEKMKKMVILIFSCQSWLLYGSVF